MVGESIDELKRKIKILESKLAEQSTQKDQAINLPELLKTSADVFYCRNLKTNKYDYISESMYNILGYTAEEFTNFPIETVLELIHPADRSRINDFFSSFLNYTNNKEKKFNIEYRIKHKKGQYVWVNENISMIRDEKSNPLNMVGNLRDVSVRKKTEQEILKNEALLTAIIENIPGSLWSIDKNYNFIQGNSVFNQEIKNILHREFQEGINVLANIPDEDYQQWKTYYDRALAGETFIIEQKRKYGLLKSWNEYHFAPIISRKNEIIGATVIAYDISVRKQNETALLESEEKFKQYAQFSPIGIYTTDLNGDCTYANETWLEMAGMSLPEALGKGWIEALHPDDQLSISEKWYKAIQSKGKWGYEYRFKTKQGEITWVYSMATELIDKEGNASGYLGTNININQIKQAEQELQRNKQKLEELNTTKDKLFSIIAHDLKSPFNSIIGFSELLVKHIQEKQYDKIQQFSQIILNESKITMDLLTNLLEWSRSQTGTIPFAPRIFNLCDLIQEVVDMFEITAARKQISISNKKNIEIDIVADRNMIHTVLRNLITNAIKFTNAGGKISIETQRDNHFIIVTVRDTGIGISPEQIKKLFKIGDTSSTKGTGGEKGTGLGLILCKEFIKKHGGKIWAESETTKGTSFHFSIPDNRKN